MAKTNPFEFLQQVRAEGAKVTWPTRKETMITTVMVFVMVDPGELVLPGRRPDPALGRRASFSGWG